MATLHADLASGRCKERYGHLLGLEEPDLGYRLIRCEIGGRGSEQSA